MEKYYCFNYLDLRRFGKCYLKIWKYFEKESGLQKVEKYFKPIEPFLRKGFVKIYFKASRLGCDYGVELEKH
jgi:hypothetical protein